MKPVCSDAISRQYQEGHINWFYTNWRPSWILTTLVIRKYFLEYFIIFVILKNICIEVNFVHLWYWEFDIRKFLFFFFFLGGGGGGGRCSLDFHEGQLFVIYMFKSQKVFRMSTLFECKYLEDNFLVQSGDFCIHGYKIRFCKKVYISPYPKIVIFNIMCNRRSSCAA